MIRIIKDSDQWKEVLQQCKYHDSYHTFEYHKLSRSQEEYPYLFVYEYEDIIIALPLLLRDIKGSNFKDATSVYGYAGPAYNAELIDEKVVLGFTADLEKVLLEMNIISVFSRLHSYFPQQLQILHNLGKLVRAGQLVYIDLKQPTDIQRAKYNNRLKTQINKLRR